MPKPTRAFFVTALRATLLALSTGAMLFVLALGAGRARAEKASGALAGAQYGPARAFVAAWCGECHTQSGTNPKQARAYKAQRLDTYDQWRTHQSVLRGVIDKWHPDGKIMPPPGAKSPPDAERRAVLEWIDRGSPNTPEGK
jgi:uncharacterized membrane protein